MFLAIDLNALTSINYIFYVVLGLAILAGFLRGFKKTIFTLIMMAIFYVVFFVTINQAVEFLWTFEMPWLGNVLGGVDPALSNFTTFEASLNTFMEIGLGDTIDLTNSSVEVIALATGIMKFVLKLVWTLVYFTAILLIYKIICFIIAAIFLRTKGKASKNRGLGAAVGVANGLMGVFVLLIMMGGLMSVLESAATLIPEEEPTPLSHVSTLANRGGTDSNPFDGTATVIPLADTQDLEDISGQLQAMIDAYNSNIFVTVANKITTTSALNETVEVPLHINLFDTVLSFDYNEKTIGFRYELQVFSAAANIFLESDYYETNDITDITGQNIRDAFSYLSESNLIVSLMPVAIEVAADMNEMDLGIDHDTLYSINFGTELTNLGSIAGSLFDVLNGAGFIGGEGSVEQIEIDGETVIEIFDDMSNSETIVLLTETLLLPMLEDSEGEFSAIIEVPADFDIEAEFVALGKIFAQIVELDDISFENLASGDMNVLLDAVSQMDLEDLLDSQLITEALINILSGEANIEGLDILEVPAGIEWKNVGTVKGELSKILSAITVLFDVVDGVDFENLDIDTLLDLSDAQIETFFDSYVIRATVSDIIGSTDLGDIPLVFPDSIYDTQDYFTKTELVSVIKAVKMMYDSTTGGFDIMKAFNLTSPETDTLLASNIISATIGKEIYDLGSTSLVIPNSTKTTVTVDGLAVDVITNAEVKSVLSALSVLELTDLDNVSFDAGILDNLKNTAGDALDDTKLNTLLNSAIIHATVSDMVLDLDASEGGALVIPVDDQNGNPIKTYLAADDLYFIEKTEVIDLLKALDKIGISNFASIDLEDTSLIVNNIDVLIHSSIIQATISDFVLDMDAVLTFPEQDAFDQDILIVQGATTFIDKDEVVHLFAALDILGFTDPTAFNTEFSFAVFEDSDNYDTLLDSGIMHATISDKMFNLAGGTLIIPTYQDNGTTLVRLETGSVGAETEFIETNELKTLFAAIDDMGITDFNDLNGGVTSSQILAIDSYITTSSIIQATISDQIINSGSADLKIPDSVLIPLLDVTYITKTELEDFIDGVNLLSISDFSTFSIDPSMIASLDLDAFFDSEIQLATISKYVLDQAGDETSPSTSTQILVPTTLREDVVINTLTEKQIQKQELIDIIKALDVLNMENFNDSVDTSVMTTLTTGQLNTVLNSGSFHLTINNKLRTNASINADIPALAENTYYGLASNLVNKAEIVNFIIAINTVSDGAGNFSSTVIDLAAVAGLDATERGIVLNSRIIRNKITPDLETLDLGDPTYAFNPLTDYEDDPVQDFLNKVACLDALEHFYPAA